MTPVQLPEVPDRGALHWLNEMDHVLMRMKGRPFSEKQRSAILGVLLTLDPGSPFYVPNSRRALLTQPEQNSGR